MDEYKRLLADAVEKQVELIAKRNRLMKEVEETDRHLLGLAQAIDGYQFILGENTGMLTITTDPEVVGFTDAIRGCFTSSKPLFPTQIRNALAKAGYERNSDKTLLINVHNTLGRLESQGELEKVEIEGKTAYRKVTKITSAPPVGRRLH